jgi:hypothetical protein
LKSRAQAGQVYVALSRARSLAGLTVLGFDPAKVKQDLAQGLDRPTCYGVPPRTECRAQVKAHPKALAFMAGLRQQSADANAAVAPTATAAATSEWEAAMGGRHHVERAMQEARKRAETEEQAHHKAEEMRKDAAKARMKQWEARQQAEAVEVAAAEAAAAAVAAAAAKLKADDEEQTNKKAAQSRLAEKEKNVWQEVAPAARAGEEAEQTAAEAAAKVEQADDDEFGGIDWSSVDLDALGG